MTLDDIRNRCVMRDDHWIFRGAKAEGKWPRIWAPDYTNGGIMRAQVGRRAVWHVMTGKPIAPGLRVWGTCEHLDCLAPEHCKCGTTAEWGAFMSASGVHKTSIPRKVANLALSRKRSHLTIEQMREIQASSETGLALAKVYGVSDSTISKAKKGAHLIARVGGNPFAGLMR